MQPAENGRTVPRYFVQPQKPVSDSKAALVLLYDIMGFQTVSLCCLSWRLYATRSVLMRCQVNPKIIADEYADKLGIPVFIPDYIRKSVYVLIVTSAIS